MDFIDFHRCSLIFSDSHVFTSIFMDLHGFSWICMVLHGFERFWDQDVGRPWPPCEPLWRHVAADWIPLILTFQILEAWIWRPGAWMCGCWKDWNGLEEVTEGIGVGAGDRKDVSHAQASGARRLFLGTSSLLPEVTFLKQT